MNSRIPGWRKTRRAGAVGRLPLGCILGGTRQASGAAKLDFEFQLQSRPASASRRERRNPNSIPETRALSVPVELKRGCALIDRVDFRAMELQGEGESDGSARCAGRRRQRQASSEPLRPSGEGQGRVLPRGRSGREQVGVAVRLARAHRGQLDRRGTRVAAGRSPIPGCGKASKRPRTFESPRWRIAKLTSRGGEIHSQRRGSKGSRHDRPLVVTMRAVLLQCSVVTICLGAGSLEIPVRRKRHILLITGWLGIQTGTPERRIVLEAACGWRQAAEFVHGALSARCVGATLLTNPS